MTKTAQLGGIQFIFRYNHIIFVEMETFHSITEVLGLEGTCGNLQSNPLLKQVHPEQGAQGPTQWIFNTPEKETPQPLWQPGQCPCHPPSKEDFPHIQMELPVFQFVPTSFFAITVHHKGSDLWKSSSLSRQLTSIFNATAGIKELLGNIFFPSWGSTLKVTEFCGVCYTKLLFLTLTFFFLQVLCVALWFLDIGNFLCDP